MTLFLLPGIVSLNFYTKPLVPEFNPNRKAESETESESPRFLLLDVNFRTHISEVLDQISKNLAATIQYRCKKNYSKKICM